VLRTGAESEMMSGLSGDDVRFISEAPGIAHNAGGAVSSPELFVIINLPMRSTGTDANVPMRGVQPTAPEVRKDFEIVEGRMYEPGLNEVIVGVGAVGQFSGLSVGSTIEVGQEQWPVVGIFSAAGGMAESEIWVDAAVLQQAYRRGNSYQSVSVKLDGADAFDQFKDALTSDPRLNVKPMRASEYYASQSTTLYNLITGLGTTIAIIMGLGAIFGALNTMYTAVSARTVEIATLRALGFGSLPVVVSVIIESLSLALLGGLLGAGIVFLIFDGYTASTLNNASFSQVAFDFAVTPQLLQIGIGWALTLGLIGGLFPAVRAARLPITVALRGE